MCGECNNSEFSCCFDFDSAVPGMFPGWPPMGIPPAPPGQPQGPAAAAAPTGAAAAASPTPVAPTTAAQLPTPTTGSVAPDLNQAQVRYHTNSHAQKLCIVTKG